MNTKSALLTGGVLVIALAITVTFVVAEPSSLLSKTIACGGIAVATLGAIKTLLEIVKLTEENAKLKAERDRVASSVYLPSTDDIDRFIVEPRRSLLSHMSKSTIIGMMVLAIGISSWAGVMLNDIRANREDLKSIRSQLEIEQGKLETERRRVQLLELENRVLKENQKPRKQPPPTRPQTNNTGSAAVVKATSGSPQSAMVGEVFSSPLQVTVTDTSGNAVGGAAIYFAVLPAAGGASAILSRPSATTSSLGVASVTATANSTAGAYSVTATVAGITPATFSLTNKTEAEPLGPPTLTVQNGFENVAIDVSVVGPTRSNFTLQPAQVSERINLQKGEYVISAKARGYNIEDQKIFVLEHSTHHVKFHK
jgi:hypothetical protein